MTQLRCDDCGDNFEAPSLDEVAKHPATGEALCPECAHVSCEGCQRELDVGDLTESHVHENGGFACDTCPVVEFPYEFEMTFRSEPEGYTPSFIDDVFPDVRVGNDHNADGISREWWRWVVRVTFRAESTVDIYPVAVNGTSLEGVE